MFGFLPGADGIVGFQCTSADCANRRGDPTAQLRRGLRLWAMAGGRAVPGFCLVYTGGAIVMTPASICS